MLFLLPVIKLMRKLTSDNNRKMTRSIFPISTESPAILLAPKTIASIAIIKNEIDAFNILYPNYDLILFLMVSMV